VTNPLVKTEVDMKYRKDITFCLQQCGEEAQVISTFGEN